MKMFEAINMAVAINQIQADTSTKLPTKVGLLLAINGRKLADIVKSFEESRQVLAEKFGKHNEDGELERDAQGGVPIETSNIKAFTEEMNELNQFEVEVAVSKVGIEAFPAELQAGYIAGLYPMINEA